MPPRFLRHRDPAARILGTEGHTLIDVHLNSRRSNYSSTRQMEMLITGRFISVLRELRPVVT